MIEYAFKFLDIFEDKRKRDYLRVALIESLRRELKFNEILLRDIINLKGRKKNPIPNYYTLLCDLKTSSIDDFFKTGIPISTTFDKKLKIEDFQGKEYSKYFRKSIEKLVYEWEYIEKAFTKLVIAKEVASKGIEKNIASINHLIEWNRVALMIVNGNE